MTRRQPRVSIVVIFLNAAAFLQEAVGSVFAQTFDDWELLLVDDGSTDESTAIARGAAAEQPDRVRYFEHHGHANLGMSASRNLGLQHAVGEFVAFLDADDVWMPEKLERQLAIAAQHPTAALIYGPAWYWHAGAAPDGSQSRDFMQNLKVPANTLVTPPELVPLFIADAAVTPSPSGVLVNRKALSDAGGSEPEFRGMYEDQVLCVKMALRWPVFVSGECWYRYRQHAGSCCTVAFQTNRHLDARRQFLSWVERHTAAVGVRHSAIEKALRQERRKLEPSTRLGSAVKASARKLLPEPALRWLRGLRTLGEERI